MSIRSKAVDVAAKPGDAWPGQKARATAAHAAAEARHHELVTAISSAADAVRAGLQPTLNGIAVNAARPFTVVAGLQVQRIATSSCRLLGWSLLNSSGTACVVRMRAGRDGAAGDVVAVVAVAANTSTTVRLGSGGGVAVGADGLTMTVDQSAATVEGSVYLGEVD